MKIKLFVMFLGSVIVVSNPSFSQEPGSNRQSQQKASTVETNADSAALADVLAVRSAMPRGPQDLLQEYEAGMAAITQQFSARLAAIADAVQRGQLTREQGESLSAEQYQLAQMQFDLLSALREMLGEDLARATAAQQPTRQASQQTTPQSEIVMVALPFSSLQLSDSLVEYLDLSSAQVTLIERVLSDERRQLAPLMAQMQTTKEQLLIATEQGQSKDDKEVRTLAATQARNLTKLIVANSQMQTRIYQLLSPQQQKKLGEFQRK